MDLVVEPHVGDGHPVLGQGACLVRADGGGRAQRFHSLQVLYQAVLTSHSLSSQCQTHLRARRDKNKEGKRRKNIAATREGKCRGKDSLMKERIKTKRRKRKTLVPV